VADYFAMLEKEVLGKPFSKSDHRTRRLLLMNSLRSNALLRASCGTRWVSATWA
jgi:hypothetical protein